MFKPFASYKTIDKIGEGLNASVYKVSKFQPDIKADHIFALKVLKDSSDIKVFKLEFETLLKAHGKHLVRYFGWEHYKSRPALLLEYIDGVTLHEFLNAFPVSTEEAHWIYSEVAEGLKELNNCGLTHGDLSLKNIMLQRNGQLKLIDFGLSHWSTQKVELTPEFADPSLFQGDRPSHSSDLFSLKKIINKICPENSIAEEQEKTLSAAPQSLINKVIALKEPHADTLSFGLKSEGKPSKTQKLKFAAWSLTSLLFFTPASAYNNLRVDRVYQIRSANWLQITNEQGQTCFTPCSLNLKSQSLETLSWKVNNKTGTIKVYTGSDKIISIDI